MFTKINLFLENKLGDGFTLGYLLVTFFKCLFCAVLSIPIIAICLSLVAFIFYVSFEYAEYSLMLIYLIAGVLLFIKIIK